MLKQPAVIELAIVQAKMLARNVSFWSVSLLIAGLSMLVFGYLFKPDSRPFDLAVVDDDATQTSQSLTAAFVNVENVHVSTPPREEKMRRFQDGKLGAVVIVPSGFEAGLTQGQTPVEVYFDASDPVRASYAQTTVAGVIEAFNRQALPNRAGAIIDSRGQDTKHVRFIDFLTPGMVGMTIMWTNLVVGALMITWREQGILRRLGTTPLRPSTLVAAQAISFASISVVQSAIVLALGAPLFGVQLHGSIFFLLITVFLGIMAMLGIGYAISSFTRTTPSAHAVGQLVAFPMMFLGGSYFPMNPPGFMRPVVDAIPLSHLNDALREVVNYGGGFSNIGIDWLVLLAWAAGGFIASSLFFAGNSARRKRQQSPRQTRDDGGSTR